MRPARCESDQPVPELPPRRRLRLPWQAVLVVVAVATTAWCWWQTFDRLFVTRLIFDWVAVAVLLTMLRSRKRVLGSTPLGWAAAAALMVIWFLGERIADYFAYTHTGRPHMGLGSVNARMSAILLVCIALAIRDEWRYWTALRLLERPD